jgi:hypothetical protein
MEPIRRCNAAVPSNGAARPFNQQNPLIVIISPVVLLITPATGKRSAMANLPPDQPNEAERWLSFLRSLINNFDQTFASFRNQGRSHSQNELQGFIAYIEQTERHVQPLIAIGNRMRATDQGALFTEGTAFESDLKGVKEIFKDMLRGSTQTDADINKLLKETADQERALRDDSDAKQRVAWEKSNEAWERFRKGDFPPLKR